MQTDLWRIRSLWEAAAQRNAAWHVCTGDVVGDGLFAIGEIEIDATLRMLETRGLGMKRCRALDFGCGIGRLSLALARHYDHVDGIDISAGMISRARLHPGVTYHRLDTLRSLSWGEYDLIYSDLVLQHMPSDLQRPYVTEFVRLLAGDGVAVFDNLEGSLVPNPENPISLWNADHEEVEAWIRDAGGILVERDPRGTKMTGVVSNRYVVTRGGQ